MASVKHNITAAWLEINGYRQLFAGDDYDYTINVKVNGVAQDLASAKIWFTIKAHHSDADVDALLAYTEADQIAIQAPTTDGQFIVSFLAADTTDLAGLWWYDCKVLFNTGKIAHVAYGQIEFLPTITRATS